MKITQVRYLFKKNTFLLDLIFLKRFNRNARARPVGTGELGTCCGDLFGTFGSVQFDIYFTDLTQGSTPLKQRLDVSLNRLRRGSRWLAFFNLAEQSIFKNSRFFSKTLLLAKFIYSAQLILNIFNCLIFPSDLSENDYAI